MSESVDVAITTVTSTLITASIIGNSLICAVIKKNRDMRIPVNYLLVNLAVADMIYAACRIPKFIVRYSSIHPDGVTGKVLCTLLTDGNLSWVGAASSIFTLGVIAIERYYVVMYPYGNKRKVTKHNLKVIIPGFWIFSFIVSVPAFLNEEFEIDRKSCTTRNREKWITNTYFFTWFVMVAISFMLMVSLYSRIVYVLWIKRNDETGLTHQQKGVLKVRKRVTLMVVAVSAIFGICWGTDEALHVIEQASNYRFSPDLFIVTHTLIMFNTALNPFAYALINQRFREKMKQMFCSSSDRVHAAEKPQDIEISNINRHSPPIRQERVPHSDSLGTNYVEQDF